MSTTNITRRAWLSRISQSATLLAMPTILPRVVFGQGDRPAPSKRISLAIIGLGSMGLRHVKGFIQEGDCQLVAVCDVDAERRKVAVDFINQTYGDTGCAQYNDFRELLARRDLDAVCIAVPDHWHAIIAMTAMHAGKAIYGEKPLALTVADGRRMSDCVRQTGCVWQTGSWQRSTWQFRFGAELVRNGRIGKLLRVEVGNPAGEAIAPQPAMPVPAGLDYELWLGPAPWAPYTEKRCHWNFRWILDYSGGQLTDNGAHDIDIAHWGMDCDYTGPRVVEGVGEFPVEGLWNVAVRHHVICTYANGVQLFIGDRMRYAGGVRWIGEKGWVHASRDKGLVTFPKQLLTEKLGPEETHLDKSLVNRQGHLRNFLDCIKTRAKTIAPIEVAHRTITVAHLGNIAMLLGRKIRWNPETEQIADDPTATRMLSRPYRGSWGTDLSV
jgi:predicted dehydrogenase